MPALSHNRPADLDHYWKATLDELEGLPPAAEEEELPLRSTGFATMYGVRLTSIGPYRVFGYLSVPRGAGPFPARYYSPRYGSVVEPVPQGGANAMRGQYVTMSIGVRGQRGSDQPFAASFPGLLTEGIDDARAYVFRGIVADCCRGLQYLLSRPEVDTKRVAVIGNDLALVTAALCPQVAAVVCTPALFHATSDLAPRTQAYPLEEINDYLRYDPSKREAVHCTLSYFDLRWFAPRVRASTLIVVEGGLLDRETLRPLAEALGPRVQLYDSEHSGYKDGLFAERWLAQQLGVAEVVVPEAWR